MYQVFRLLSILFMGLTSATFFISLLIATLFLGYGKPIFSIVTPIIFLYQVSFCLPLHFIALVF